MKVLIAIDSMKGSLNSMEAGRAAAEGIRRAKPEAVITVKPLADGGEGTLQALTEGLGGRMETVQVCGPLGDLVQACYGILPDGKTAVLSLVPEEKRDPRRATSFGTGQMIREAIRQGCRDFIIGIGGSATTDGGAGMLSALGYEFLDEEGRAVEPGIGALDRIVCIRSEQKPPELEQCRFRIACDVSNPLLGEQGAVWVYGPQKGVREEEKSILDQKMRHFAEKIVEFTGRDARGEPGAGAAGGLGFRPDSHGKGAGGSGPAGKKIWEKSHCSGRTDHRRRQRMQPSGNGCLFLYSSGGHASKGSYGSGAGLEKSGIDGGTGISAAVI